MKQITQNFQIKSKEKKNLRFQKIAINVLQKATEIFMIENFEMINLIVIHVKRMIIQFKNMIFLNILRHKMIEINYDKLIFKTNEKTKLKKKK